MEIGRWTPATRPDQKPVAIQSLKVRRLFGYFTYRMPDPEHCKLFQNIIILYGDNGSGKTTILNLIHHIISPESNKGHRTAISAIPFQSIQIALTNGDRILVKRDETYKPGPYAITVTSGGKPILFWQFEGSKKINKRDQDEDKFYSYLQELNIRIYFLPTDRTFSLTADTSEIDDDLLIGQYFVETYQGRKRSNYEGQKRLILNNTAESVRTWVLRRAVHGTNIGTENTAHIYTEIVQRIIHSPRPINEASTVDRDNLTIRLKQISVRADSFARFELTPRLDFSQMSSLIVGADQTALQLIDQILSPLIDSLNARFDALDGIRELIARFVDILNSFYSYKQVVFTLADGIKFKSAIGSDISPVQLSSGEQHLLLLFCHALITQDRPSIFIIDEPELSLNIKWQRMLIAALQDITQGTRVQFIFATHSVEFISQHREYVARLTNSDDPE